MSSGARSSCARPCIWRPRPQLRLDLQNQPILHAASAAHASPAAARTTLALVKATTGLAFAVDLAVRGEHVALAVFAQPRSLLVSKTAGQT